MPRLNVDKDLATKAVSLYDMQPSGRGSGSDLLAAVTNSFQSQKDVGAIPAGTVVKIEDAVDISFLPK